MSNRATAMMQAGLAALHASGLASLAAPWTRGEGVIFTLHSVHPEAPAAFDPNGVLRIMPEFLETAIETVRKQGYDTVSLDEAATRLKSPGSGRPFVCFTLDDGYRDNREHAYPVFKKHGVPFAIYVPAAYADGQGDLWWYALEGALRKADRLAITLANKRFECDLTSPVQKTQAFHEIYWTLRGWPEPELRAGVRAIGEAAGYDATTLCRDLIMDWDKQFARSRPIRCSPSAHTRSITLPSPSSRTRTPGLKWPTASRVSSGSWTVPAAISAFLTATKRAAARATSPLPKRWVSKRPSPRIRTWCARAIRWRDCLGCPSTGIFRRRATLRRC